IDELVHRRGNEFAEADFDNWSLPKERRADSRANHRRFRDRRLADPVRAKFGEQPVGTLERAAHLTDILADVEDTRVAPHLAGNRVEDCLSLRHPPQRHAKTSSSPSSAEPASGAARACWTAISTS